MEAQVSNIFLSILNEQKNKLWVVDHPGFLSRRESEIWKGRNRTFYIRLRNPAL